MNESDRQAFANELNELMAFYEAHAINREFWWTALNKYPIEQVEAGFESHIADPEHGNYPPKPAHIIRHIERLYPKRSGCYALYKPESQNATKRLPLTYEVAPEHFNHLMRRAMLFAEGKGSKEDKHEHLQELIQICKGSPLPYDKEEREEETCEEA